MSRKALPQTGGSFTRDETGKLREPTDRATARAEPAPATSPAPKASASARKKES